MSFADTDIVHDFADDSARDVSMSDASAPDSSSALPLAPVLRQTDFVTRASGRVDANGATAGIVKRVHRALEHEVVAGHRNLQFFVWLGLPFQADRLGIAPANQIDIAKIGIIDAQRILETSSAGKAAQAQIKEKSVRMAEDLKKRGSEVEQLRTQLEREAMVMSQEKREDARREFRIKMNDFKSLEQKYRSELKQLEQKLVGRIQADIIQLTQEIGKQGGYLLIINRPAVLYSPTSIDITDQVIQKYNTKYAKGQTEASSKN